MSEKARDPKLLRADPNFSDKEANWDYDESNPEFLLGKEVSILWADSKVWYKGKIDSWDEKNGKHHISYEDNDKRWHRLMEYSFSLFGFYGQHLAEKQDEPYRPKFEEYAPKDPDAKTRTCFHCIVDTKWLESKGPIQLCVKGNLAHMGTWEGEGVPMQRDPVNPSHWFVHIELPFSLNEMCPKGIFEWKFGVIQEGKTIVEGGLNRRERSCRRHYYARLKSSRKAKSLFKGYKLPTIKDSNQTLILNDFKTLLEGKMARKAFMSRLSGIHLGLKGTRAQGEETVDKALALLTEKSHHGVQLLAILAVVGRFGLSNKEYDEVERGGEKVKRKKELKPRPWCWYILKNLDIAPILKSAPKALLGNHYHWALNGVLEAADRAMGQCDFSWLRIAPLLKKNNITPARLQIPNAGLPHVFKVGEKIRCNYKKKGRWYGARITDKLSNGTFYVIYDDGDEEGGVQESQMDSLRGTSKAATKTRKSLINAYNKIYKEIIELGLNAIQTGQSILVSEAKGDAKIRMDVSDEKNEKKGSEEDEKKRKENMEKSAAVMEEMGLNWLKTLITYSPTTETLEKLFGEPTFAIHATNLIPEVTSWVEKAVWELGELSTLQKIILTCTAIGHPSIAEALFRSDSCVNDDKKFIDTLVKSVVLCCNNFDTKMFAKSPGTDTKEDPKEAEIIKAFSRMDSAAYLWFKKCFSEKPALEERRRVTEGYTTKWVIVEKSPKEQEKALLETLVEACRVINNLMAIKYFLVRPQSILFELDRCKFMKSRKDPSAVLKILTKLGAMDKKGFDRFSLPLSQFMSKKCTKILHEVVPFVKNDSKQLMKVLEAVDELPRDSRLNHTLVHTLLATAGTRSFKGILQNSTLWKVIFTTRGIMKPNQAMSTPLTEMLFDAQSEVINAANALLPMPKSFTKLANATNLPKSIAVKMITQGYDDVEFLRDYPEEEKWIAHSGITKAECKQLVKALGTFGSADLRLMHVIMAKKKDFLQLLSLLNYTELKEGRLDAHITDVKDFDKKLSQTKFFLSFFCDCGVRINVDSLNRIIKTWSSDYDNIKLSSIHSKFDNLMTSSHLRSFEWLYETRTSALFLNLWRQTGKEMVRKYDAKFRVSELKRSPVLNRMGGGDIKISDSKKFALLDEMSIKYKLSQKEVIERLIPAVRTKWRELRTLVKTGKITVPHLEQTFATLPTDEHYASELVVLARTGRGMPINEDVEWIKESMLALKDFSMLMSMKNSIPAILRLRNESLASLFTSNETKGDTLFTQLTNLETKLKSEWEKHTLKSLSVLIGPVKKELGTQLTSIQLRFLTLLGDKANDPMTAWMLKQKNQGQFNQWRQFATDSCGEANVLNAVASTVALRTSLLRLLYQRPPYANLKAFMDCFRSEVEMNGYDTLSHLSTVCQGFNLLQRNDPGASSGLKACNEVIQYLKHGVLHFHSSSNSNEIMWLNPHWEKKEKEGKDAKLGTVAAAKAISDAKIAAADKKDLEYLLDLRSKIVMTEIPKRLEEMHDMKRLIASFLDQLHIALDIKQEIQNLITAGHFAFQEDYVLELKLGKSTEEFHKKLKDLKDESANWKAIVKSARQKHYLLNFFTMRELIKLIRILNGKERARKEAIHKKERGEAKEEKGDEKENIIAVPDSWSCPACQTSNKMEYVFCMMCTHERPKKWTDILAKFGGKVPKKKRKRTPAKYRENYAPYDSVEDMIAILHLTSSKVDEDNIRKSFSSWSIKLKSGVEALSKNDSKLQLKTNAFKLQTLGEMLQSFTTGPHTKEGKEGKKTTTSSSKTVHIRAIPPPGRNAKNAADLLIRIEEEKSVVPEKRSPIFVACAKSPQHVIEVVLSVYVRRSRLPEPGEILFCNAETTLEEIELLFYRFLSAKSHGRGHFVFCVADVHALNYTQQVAVLDRLREVMVDYGTNDAASLLFVSGKPRQVLLNTLSAHMVALEPLDEKSLQVALQYATKSHCGETLCVASEINGAGKTTYILKEVGMRQRRGDGIQYRRVVYHESSTSGTLVDRLSKFSIKSSNAFHMHIGHIIPPNANTCLFELLIVGTLKNKETCDVYARSSRDVYYLEIPNSSGDKTAHALRFCKLLPSQHLRCNAESLSYIIPVFRNPPLNSRIRLQLQPFSTDPMVYTVHFLKAFSEKKFQTGGRNFDPQWDPNLTEAPKEAIAFRLLQRFTENKRQPGDAPSFLIFDNFCRFMKDAFLGMDPNYGYEPLKPVYVQFLEGLETFRHAFCSMLIATSKDFALRAVPRGRQFGRVESKASEMRRKNPITARSAEDEELAIALSLSLASKKKKINLPSLPKLGRIPSSELRKAQQAAAAQETPTLTRQDSNEMAARFTNMTKWDDTDHPVCLWYPNVRQGDGFEGFDILSLNEMFTQQYISRGLFNSLNAAVPGGFKNLNRDWKNMRSEEGVRILKQVEGYTLRFGATEMKIGKPDPSYVITIDNLLKMLSIQLRLKNGLPVVIMGETGCGKSSLIRQLCAVLNLPLRILNIHGGMNAQDIVEWMMRQIKDCEMLTSNERLVILLDEVNTCNCMGLFKEIVCDRSVQGRFLPDNIKVIAACNPYRLKSKAALKAEGCGLVFDHFEGKALGDNVGTGIKDPLKNLVYRVHPLPESMIDHVFDFGALPADTESIYIRAMLKRQLGIYLRQETKDQKVSSGGGGEKGDVKTVVNEKERIKNLITQAIHGSKSGQLHSAQMAHRHLHSIIAQQRTAEQQASQSGQQAPKPELSQEEIKKMMEDIEKDSKQDGFIDFVEVFAKLICTSQEFVRKFYSGERSVVSLRDVARCVEVFRWFGEHFANYIGKNAPEKWDAIDFFNVKPVAREFVRSAMIMSLAYCFHARLDRKGRREYGLALQRSWERMQEPIGYEEIGTLYAALFGGKAQRVPKYGPRCTWLGLNAGQFTSIVNEVMRSFVSNLKLGSGIALNEALLENLFMIMISVLNRIPIFVVGKPGTSKSLAMGLIQANMNGEASDNAFLRSLPAVEIFSYQCSPLSTSSGIQQAFDSARRYKMQSPNVITVVLLDEVGLAEQSPHLPLKVLHKVLDEGGDYALVGISNWALDPAKMNRAVHLYRPAPTVEDLSRTAQGMVQSAMLGGFLNQIARAYNAVYEKQKQRDFWGLREFYSTVKHINRQLNESKSQTLDGKVLMNAIQRNFGGKPEEASAVIQKFFSTLGITENEVPRLDTTDLIRQNIVSPEARHLMLLTKNNAALRLLFDYKLREHDITDVIFGSDFPLDKTDLQICLNLQTLKNHMALGRTVVLVYCEALYESLYDLLNQHYTEFGGKQYVRLAFGTSNKLCEIHRDFRVIVIVEKLDAYNRLAPPLLNRFEKQVLERKNLLTGIQKQVVATLKDFCTHFVLGQPHGKVKISKLRASIAGFHTDMLSSLVQSMPKPDQLDQFTRDCIERLLWLATPEAACRALENNNLKLAIQQAHAMDIVDTYFRKQHHSDMVDFAGDMLEKWSDDMGSQIVLLTFSPMSLHSGSVLRDQTKWKKVTVCTLHELSTERDLKQAASEFFATATDGSVFLLQCDPQAGSVRRIEHAKYILEKLRAQHARSNWKKDSKTSEGKGSKKDAKVHETKVKDEKVSETKKIQSESKSEGKTEGKGNELKTSEGKDAKQNEGKDAKTSRVEGKSSSAPGEVEEISSGHGIHIVVLVHLPRRDGKFLIDLDKNWRYAFIDDIEPAANTGLPDIQSMLDTSLQMVDIVKKLNFRQVLLSSFRQALARLSYQSSRTNEDVKQQIGFLLRSLRNDDDFLRVISHALYEIVGQSNESLDVSKVTEKSEELAIAGTFQAALHRQILEVVSSAFALLLSHADRNSQLQMLDERKYSIRSHWLSLFTRSLKDLQFVQTSLVKAKGPTIEVTSDGSKPFKARFPFSFFIYKVLAEFSALIDNSNDPIRALQRQFTLMNFENNLDGKLSSDLIRRYVYDFTCMHCKYLENISREAQAKIVWSVLRLYNNNKDLTLLSEVHSLYIMCERTLEECFGLITAVPPAVGKIVEYITQEAKDCSGAMELEMVSIVMSILRPSRQGWLKVSSYMQWMMMIEDVRPIIDGILNFAISEATENEHVAKMHKEISSRWEKLIFVYTFIRDVSLPMQVEPKDTLKTLDPIDSNKAELRTSSTFRSIIKMFSELRFKIINPAEDFICPITLEPFKEPVILVGDGRTYERKAIEEWLEHHDTAPMTNLPLQTKELRPNIALEAKTKALASEEMLTAAASRFMEFYVFGLCFGSPERCASDPKLIVDFIMLLAGKKLGKTSIDVMPSEAGRVALVRCLLCHPEKKLREHANNILLKALAMTIKKAKYLDTSLAVHYASVKEQQYEQEILSVKQAIPAMNEVCKSLNVFENKKASPAVVLDLIAKVRCILSRAAETVATVLTDQNDEKKSVEIKHSMQVKLLCNQLEKLLLMPSKMKKQIRMFFLKNLERGRGITFLRAALQQPPLGTSNWMNNWRESGEGGIIRFLGQNKLPRNNPFKNLQHFSDIDNALAAGLSPTASNFSVLLKTITTIRESKSSSIGKVKGALLAAVFHECYLLGALPQMPKSTKERIDKLSHLILKGPEFSFLTKKERNLIGFFCLYKNKEQSNPIEKYFQIDQKMKTKRILLIRLCVHVGVWALSSEDSDLGKLMHTMITDPGKLAKTWLPCMVEDVTAMAVAALGGRWYKCSNGHAYYVDNCGLPMEVLKCATCGVKIGGKNHTLLSGQKDLDTKLQGSKQGARRTQIKDNSEPGYCLRTSKSKENPFESVRSLTPTSNRTIRIIMHAALLLSRIVHPGQNEWNAKIKSVCNPQFITEKKYEKLFLNHYEKDFKTLTKLVRKSEDTVDMLLHAILALSSKSSKEEKSSMTPEVLIGALYGAGPMQINQITAELKNISGTFADQNAHIKNIMYFRKLIQSIKDGSVQPSHIKSMAHSPALPGFFNFLMNTVAPIAKKYLSLNMKPPPTLQGGMQGLFHSVSSNVGINLKRGQPVFQSSNSWATCATPARRAQFEDMLGKQIMSWFDTKTLGVKIESAAKMFSTQADNVGSVFMAELLEKVDVRSMPRGMRAELNPALWRYRAPFSIEDFTLELNRDADNKEKFPLLTNFLGEENTLRALRYLPKALEFQTLMVKRFNRAIDRESARKMTIGEAIATSASKAKWRSAFEGFKNAWALGWKFVERFGCLELPKVYKDTVIDEKSPVTFCMPQEKHEGICALALINFLCTRHNQFVELIYQRLLTRGGNMQRIDDRKSVVTTNFFSEAHAIAYDLNNKFSPFIAKNCVKYTDDGRVLYDFENAEQYLLDVFFTGKPLAKVNVRMVQYTDDEGAVDTQLFRQKVEQVTLTQEEKKIILGELGSPATAHKCLALLEMCISYLQSTGGTLIQKLDVAEILLSEYVRDVLLMENAAFGSETVKRKIKLKHIDSLFKILRDFTVTDIFENVHAKYKEALDSKASYILKESTKKLDLDVLLPVMQEVIVQKLSGGVMAAHQPICDFIGWCDHDGDFLNDLPWFEFFPKKLLMKNIVDAFKVLEELQSQ